MLSVAGSTLTDSVTTGSLSLSISAGPRLARIVTADTSEAWARAGVAKLADAPALNPGALAACGFDPRPRYLTTPDPSGDD